MCPSERPDVDGRAWDGWARAVEQLVAEVEGWCEDRDWPTRRVPKRVDEPHSGYGVPFLLFQVDLLKLMLDPAGWHPADPVTFRLLKLPEWDDVAIVRSEPAGWEFVAADLLSPDGWRTAPFTAEALDALVDRLCFEHFGATPSSGWDIPPPISAGVRPVAPPRTS